MEIMEKWVGWEAIRNVANSLTNQLLDVGGEAVDINKAHISQCFAQGALRRVTLEQDYRGGWVEGFDGGGWLAVTEEEISQIYWESLTSGNALEATKESPGTWRLRYIPSESDPDYRGCYFEIFQQPDDVKNIVR